MGGGGGRERKRKKESEKKRERERKRERCGECEGVRDHGAYFPFFSFCIHLSDLQTDARHVSERFHHKKKQEYKQTHAAFLKEYGPVMREIFIIQTLRDKVISYCDTGVWEKGGWNSPSPPHA